MPSLVLTLLKHQKCSQEYREGSHLPWHSMFCCYSSLWVQRMTWDRSLWTQVQNIFPLYLADFVNDPSDSKGRAVRKSVLPSLLLTWSLFWKILLGKLNCFPVVLIADVEKKSHLAPFPSMRIIYKCTALPIIMPQVTFWGEDGRDS